MLSRITVSTWEKLHYFMCNILLVHSNIAVIALEFITSWNDKKKKLQVWRVENKHLEDISWYIQISMVLADPDECHINVAIQAANAYVPLCLCSFKGYKSLVMVESSHIVACINWKGHRGLGSPGPSKTPMSSPAMLASGHAFKLYIDDSPW